MILTKGWFSDLKILEICEQVNSEEYEESLPHPNGNLNTDSQKLTGWIDMQNTEKRKTTNPSMTKQMLT